MKPTKCQGQASLTREAEAHAREKHCDGKLEPGADGKLALRAQAVGASAFGTVASGSLTVGALAVGALAVGALAIGALAVGRLAIRRLLVKESHFHKLVIDELEVKRLRVNEV